MVSQFIKKVMARPWVRIVTAVALLIAGLAPIGVPIVSDSSWRTAAPETAVAAPPAPRPFIYQIMRGPEGTTRVQRSADNGATWHDVAAIPQVVEELTVLPGNEQVIFARSQTGIWASEDAGATWSLTSALPSRPLSMALLGGRAEALLVGTESMGLIRSNDRGRSWQQVESRALAAEGAAPVGISALATSPEDSQIVYAASGLWLGTSQARFNPIGVFVSVDGGRDWIEMERAPLGSAPIRKLTAVPGQPLSVMAVDAAGRHQVSLTLTADLVAGLDDPDAGRRAAAARAIGLLRDPAALPLLLSHLEDSDPLVGDQIAWAIGQLGEPAAVPALLRGLAAQGEAIQARAAFALGLLRAGEAVPALAEVLRSGQPMAQRRAAEALAAIGTPEAIAALAAPLADADRTSARHAAMIGLEQAGDAAVDVLAAALSAPSPAARANAAEMLGWLKAAAASPALIQALSDSEPGVRAQAAWALGEVGTEEARLALAARLSAEEQPAVREAAQSALARAETVARGGAPVPTGFGENLLAALARIPASRWTFLGLLSVLAALLLWYAPRQARPRGA